MPAPVANKIIDDPDIKRYGEAKKFEPSVLGIEGDGVVLLVRGEPKIFEKELFKGLKEAKGKEDIIKKIEELDNAAASGVGMLFG
ncbi:hypothetical protein E2P64_00420 [Candidatus Bathyarchaeota archaeon]|nr:hypothetical protein E2P64_00420 [Candidatus Bathyarchaeota archaeon]